MFLNGTQGIYFHKQIIQCHVSYLATIIVDSTNQYLNEIHSHWEFRTQEQFLKPFYIYWHFGEGEIDVYLDRVPTYNAHIHYKRKIASTHVDVVETSLRFTLNI